MRGDDKLMTILTGIVLTVALGAVAQRGDLFQGPGAGLEPRDDVVTLAAGQSYLIDVVANDIGATEEDGKRILIMSSPACGRAFRQEGRIAYEGEDHCVGAQRIAYCIASGDECPVAEVTLVLLKGEAVESSASGTPVARIDGSQIQIGAATYSGMPENTGFRAEPSRGASSGGPLAALTSAFGSLAPDTQTADARPVD